VNNVKLTFYGAARRVTGSKHMLTTAHQEKILLDCGMFQGEGTEGDYLNRHFHFDPTTLDFVIISHAHIDHIGLLPRLVREGYSSPIYMNESTRDLTELMLADSAHIQEVDLDRINKRRRLKGLESLDPMYTMEDVIKVLEQLEVVENNKPFVVGKDTKVLFTPNAHILGSIAMHLTLQGPNRPITLAFTGDIGRPGDSILSGPDPFPQSDYIICESTYGDREHPVPKDANAKLKAMVMETCIEKNGKIIIPAFSVDRTQELIYMLDRMISEGELPPVTTYVDSPLSVRATRIMKAHQHEFNRDILDYITRDGDPFDFPGLKYVSKVEDSKKINDEKTASIIISASGMAEAGRVKHHIANNIENENNLILLVGYATPQSLAGRLKAGEPTVRIFGDEFVVKARVESMPYFSAHADWKEMLQYLSCQKKEEVKTIFLVHGSDESLGPWKSRLMQEGYPKVTIADMLMEVELN